MKRSTGVLRKPSYIISGMAALAILTGILLPLFASAQVFTAVSKGDYGNVAVMEGSGGFDALLSDGTSNTIPRELIARELYKTHKDEYDFIVLFTNFDYAMPRPTDRAF